MYSHLDLPVLGTNTPGYYNGFVSTSELDESQPAFGGLGCMSNGQPRGVQGIANGGALPGMGGVFGMNKVGRKKAVIRENGMFGLGADTSVKDAMIADLTSKIGIYVGAIGLGILIGRYVVPKRK